MHLRHIKESDLPLLVEWLNNPSVNKYFNDHSQGAQTLEKQKSWYEKYKDDSTKDVYMIETDGQPIGYGGLFSIGGPHGTCEIFIAIGDTTYWGKGVATEASRMLCEIAFSEHHLDSIDLEVDDRNPGAVRASSKLGFVETDKSHPADDPHCIRMVLRRG